MNAHPSVIGLGEALWDVFCHANGTRTRSMGGAPANFAWHVAQHGFSACAVSAVGQDAEGEELAAALRSAGAPCYLQRVPYATGEVQIELGEGGIPGYRIRPDAAWDHLATTLQLLAMASRARVLCFGSLAQRGHESRAAIAACLQAMPQDAWRICDVNLRCGFYTPEILRDSMHASNALKLNDEEMEIIGRMEGFCGLPQLEQARRVMARYKLRLLILTCGSMGSYVLTEGGAALSACATPQVPVVDTVGAGDSFTATFFAGILCGLPVAEAHAAAVDVAAFVCTQPGAMPEIPAALRLSSRN